MLHPIELREYTVDLKRLDSHWRMRVFYRTIREGHRFMKAIHPINYHDEDEAKFLAIKFLERYFEEQLALYNAICIIHAGRKHTEVCDCEQSDHSQHLATEQQPIEGYEGAILERSGGIEIDIEKYMKYNMCPYCYSPLPDSEEAYEKILKKRHENYYQEYLAVKGQRNIGMDV